MTVCVTGLQCHEAFLSWVPTYCQPARPPPDPLGAAIQDNRQVAGSCHTPTTQVRDLLLQPKDWMAHPRSEGDLASFCVSTDWWGRGDRREDVDKFYSKYCSFQTACMEHLGALRWHLLSSWLCLCAAPGSDAGASVGRHHLCSFSPPWEGTAQGELGCLFLASGSVRRGPELC